MRVCALVPRNLYIYTYIHTIATEVNSSGFSVLLLFVITIEVRCKDAEQRTAPSLNYRERHGDPCRYLRGPPPVSTSRCRARQCRRTGELPAIPSHACAFRKTRLSLE